MLTSVNHNKTAFRTNVARSGTNNTLDQLSTSKKFPSGVILSDELYFKSNHELNPEVEDHLSVLFKEGIEKRAKEVEEHAEKTPICEIFEFDENVVLNENIPGISMNFLDQLFHQLTPTSTSETNPFDDDDFTEIKESEITAVINENTEVNNNKLKEKKSFLGTIRSFLSDLYDEIDESLFLNQRKRKAEPFPSSIDTDQTTAF